jgi:AcrR family transcriptional regulator
MTQAAKVRGRPSSRSGMLDAAEAVVVEAGATRLTLDAVARQAGVSKGGVLYHFPTKDALLEALIERLVTQNESAHNAAIESLPKGASRNLKGYVVNSLGDPLHTDRVSGALLAAIAGEPKLLERVRGYFAARFPRLARGVPFERAAIVHIATEGLWFMELMQVSPFMPRQRERVAQALLRLADGDASLP